MPRGQLCAMSSTRRKQPSKPPRSLAPDVNDDMYCDGDWCKRVLSRTTDASRLTKQQLNQGKIIVNNSETCNTCEANAYAVYYSNKMQTAIQNGHLHCDACNNDFYYFGEPHDPMYPHGYLLDKTVDNIPLLYPAQKKNFSLGELNERNERYCKQCQDQWHRDNK